MLVLLGFYFLEFCLFTITAVANRAIIVSLFNSQVRAITEEQERWRIIIILSDVDSQYFWCWWQTILSPMEKLLPKSLKPGVILKLNKSKDEILLDNREELEDVFKAWIAHCSLSCISNLL